jgi:hypothetical protein
MSAREIEALSGYFIAVNGNGSSHFIFFNEKD